MTKISESRRNSRFLWLFRSLFCDLTNEPIWLLKRRTVLSGLMVYVVTRSTSSSGASHASLEKWNGNHHQVPNVVLLPLDPKKYTRLLLCITFRAHQFNEKIAYLVELLALMVAMTFYDTFTTVAMFEFETWEENWNVLGRWIGSSFLPTEKRLQYREWKYSLKLPPLSCQIWNKVIKSLNFGITK